MKLSLSFWRKLGVVVLFFSIFHAQAQAGIKVKYYTGTEQQFNIALTGKLYFSGDNLIVKQDVNSSETSLPISIIQKITFTDYILAASEIGQNKANLKLFPNPTSDSFTIAGVQQKLALNIYSLSGQLVHTQTYVPDSKIDISKLESGVYLVQINNVTFKLIKK